MSGRVVSVNISAGGVPKLRVEKAELTTQGFVDDGHHDTRHHGGPDRAACIYAVEIIDSLRAEGHPISVGSAGENVTVAGLAWSDVVPGVQLRIGETIVEVTSYTSPCKTIRRSFVNGRFQRISQITNPGWSRVYVRVLAAGRVKIGDLVEIISN